MSLCIMLIGETSASKHYSLQKDAGPIADLLEEVHDAIADIVKVRDGKHGR